MIEQTEPTTYRGLSLMDDIEDVGLRAYNRGIVLANIVDDGITAEGIMSKQSVRDSVGYYASIPEEERSQAVAVMTKVLHARGIKRLPSNFGKPTYESWSDETF